MRKYEHLPWNNGENISSSYRQENTGQGRVRVGTVSVCDGAWRHFQQENCSLQPDTK